MTTTPIPTVPVINASELVADCYRAYGGYVNTTRAVTGLDGLKTVQRRMFLAVRDEADSKWADSARVVGRCVAYHPHGEAYDTLVKLVRCSFVEGEGNFGANLLESLPAAAMRYTSVRAHAKLFESVFRLVPYVPHHVTKSVTEPEYLPVPVPLGLTVGSSGIGIGLYNSIPSFDVRSLLSAYRADDPSLLKAPPGVTLVSGDLTGLWKKGVGWVQYGLNCYKEYGHADGKTVSVIEGPTSVFVPKILDEFESELKEQVVYIRDESTNILRVVISRVKNIRRFDDDYVHKKAESAAVRSYFYIMHVSHGGSAHRVSLRDWLDICWRNYSAAVKKWVDSNVASITHQIKVYKLIPKVAPLIQSNETTSKIASTLGEPEDIIREIEGKSIRMLRNTDFNEKVNQLIAKADELTKVNERSLCDGFVEALTNSGT